MERSTVGPGTGVSVGTVALLNGYNLGDLQGRRNLSKDSKWLRKPSTGESIWAGTEACKRLLARSEAGRLRCCEGAKAVLQRPMGTLESG